VREQEPHLALFGGPDGLDIYRRLIPEARRVLKSGGLLAMEIGIDQAIPVRGMLEGWAEIQALPDLAGILRVVTARKP